MTISTQYQTKLFSFSVCQILTRDFRVTTKGTDSLGLFSLGVHVSSELYTRTHGVHISVSIPPYFSLWDRVSIDPGAGYVS